jgi:hypothetical protein
MGALAKGDSVAAWKNGNKGGTSVEVGTRAGVIGCPSGGPPAGRPASLACRQRLLPAAGHACRPQGRRCRSCPQLLGCFPIRPGGQAAVWAGGEADGEDGGGGAKGEVPAATYSARLCAIRRVSGAELMSARPQSTALWRLRCSATLQPAMQGGPVRTRGPPTTPTSWPGQQGAGFRQTGCRRAHACPPQRSCRCRPHRASWCTALPSGAACAAAATWLCLSAARNSRR